MKKNLTIILLVLLIGTFFVACSSESSKKYDSYFMPQGEAYALVLFEDGNGQWFIAGGSQVKSGDYSSGDVAPATYDKGKNTIEFELGGGDNLFVLNLDTCLVENGTESMEALPAKKTFCDLSKTTPGDTFLKIECQGVEYCFVRVEKD